VVSNVTRVVSINIGEMKPNMVNVNGFKVHIKLLLHSLQLINYCGVQCGVFTYSEVGWASRFGSTQMCTEAALKVRYVYHSRIVGHDYVYHSRTVTSMADGRPDLHCLSLRDDAKN